MSDRVLIASIVEGHGEVKALSVLLRRIAGELFGIYDLELPTPHRLPRSRILSGDSLERAVRIQAARVRYRGGVFILTDADDDCAMVLAQHLASRASKVSESRFEVAIAVREFEAWARRARSFAHPVTCVARLVGHPAS